MREIAAGESAFTVEHFQLKCLQLNPFVVLSHPFRILRGMDGAPKVLYTLELKTL